MKVLSVFCRLQNQLQRFRSAGGFTSTEIMIVMVLAGIMLVPIYALLFHMTQLKPDEQRFKILQEALAEHYRITGTLPCPANPNIDIAAVVPGAYTADCTTPWGGAVGVAGGDTVLIGALPIDDLRDAVGCGNAGGLANIVDVDLIKDTLYGLSEVLSGNRNVLDGAGNEIGTDRAENTRCPVREYIADEFGRKFIYAVVNSGTQPGFNVFAAIPAGGGITVLDAPGGNRVTVSDQPYILLSTGGDGKGGFGEDGIQRNVAELNCIAANGIDFENCNGDAVFVNAQYNNDDLGPNYYDDVVDFGIAGFLTEDSFFQWSNVVGADRNISLNANTKLVIDPPSGVAPPSLIPEDSLVINQGNVAVLNGRLTVEPDGAGTSISFIETQNSISANTNARTEGAVQSTRFCYLDSLTNSCTAILP